MAVNDPHGKSVFSKLLESEGFTVLARVASVLGAALAITCGIIFMDFRDSITELKNDVKEFSRANATLSADVAAIKEGGTYRQRQLDSHDRRIERLETHPILQSSVRIQP